MSPRAMRVTYKLSLGAERGRCCLAPKSSWRLRPTTAVVGAILCRTLTGEAKASMNFLIPSSITRSMLGPPHSSDSKIAGSILPYRAATAAKPRQGRLWEAQKSSQEPIDSSNQCRRGSSVALQELQTFSSRRRLPLLDAAGASIVGSSRCADDGVEEGEDGVSHLAALYPYTDAHL